MATYRLKIDHKNYKAGNLIYWSENGLYYNNPLLSQFKNVTMWSFSQEYINSNPEIFEKVNL